MADSVLIYQLSVKRKQVKKDDNMAIESIVLGGGCFWCLDSVFRHLEGVTSSLCAYAAGHVEHPRYEAVCQGETGHAEVMEIRYDSEIISLKTLLEIFFHHP